jgi:hypothetical protein
MSGFRAVWSSLLHWAPPPVQIAIALVIALLVITKVLPSLVNIFGAALHAVWPPLLELLTFPEFLLTSALRRRGHQPLPGTYAYGRVLGGLQPPGSRLGAWLAACWAARRPRFPWKSALLVIAVLLGCWYAAPKVPAGGPKTLLANINSDDTHVSSWIATGKWAAADPPSACTAVTGKAAASKAKAVKKPGKKKASKKKTG